VVQSGAWPRLCDWPLFGLDRALVWPGPCLAWTLFGLDRALVWPGLCLAWPLFGLALVWPGPCRAALAVSGAGHATCAVERHLHAHVLLHVYSRDTSTDLPKQQEALPCYVHAHIHLLSRHTFIYQPMGLRTSSLSSPPSSLLP